MSVNKMQVKQWIELIVAPLLLLAAVLAISNGEAFAEETSAEGQLGYAASQSMLYPGDWGYPSYPGDGPALYPGDEKWDGLIYDNLYGSDQKFHVLTSINGTVYGGMEITYSGSSTPAYKLVKWVGDRWGNVLGDANSLVNAPITAIALDGNKIYIGGYFTEVAGVPVHSVAFWDGIKWNDMGGGLSNGSSPVTVSDMVINQGKLYVSGSFTYAGETPVSNVASWSAGSWNSLGSGTSDIAWSLVVINDQLYIGGEFDQAGGTVVNGVARWDGFAWYPLSSGMVNGKVFTLATKDGQLYAGGDFMNAGNTVVHNIAQWDGTNWFALGAGLDFWDSKEFYVRTIAAAPDGIYVGGGHTDNYNNNADMLAFWTGSSWKSVGSGVRTSYPGDIHFYVNDITLAGKEVFVGGFFTQAGNNWARSVAAFRPDPVVGLFGHPWYYGIAPGSRMFLMGRFFTAGQTVSVNVNGVTLPGTLTADADGKVYFHLQTSAITSAGIYRVTLSGGGETATCTFSLSHGGTLWSNEYAGTVYDLSASIAPLQGPYMLPVIQNYRD